MNSPISYKHPCRAGLLLLGLIIPLACWAQTETSGTDIGASLQPEDNRLAAFPPLGSAVSLAGANESSSVAALPEAPFPNDRREMPAPAATVYQAPLSRIGVGFDVSPLGVGGKAAVVLNEDLDARFTGNYFSYKTGRFEISGFNVNADVHFASAGAALDIYPWHGPFRLSPGVYFYNGNQFTATANIVPGTSFSLNGTNYFSAKPNVVPGATPLRGSGILGLHQHTPAFSLTGGWGHFVPRSSRHWSFPSEFGVIFTGSPTVDASASGWVCKDELETNCGDVGRTDNPIGLEFNSNLQTKLADWRSTLGSLSVYPVFSYGVMYSFNIRR